jgi:hypothetical protein
MWASHQTWLSLMIEMAALAGEAQQVMLLRAAKFATGGAAAQAEATRMMSEKVFAAMEASVTLAFGGSPRKVVRRYRSHVRANARRLTASQGD